MAEMLRPGVYATWPIRQLGYAVPFGKSLWHF